jgi:hypothetical protein
MISASVLLKAYYERLHELMEARRADLLLRMDELLTAEIRKRGHSTFSSRACRFTDSSGRKVECPLFSAERLAAYREACVAFVDERLETYNPIGIQYTFDRSTTREAAELELQLNWYNSRREFTELVAAARSLAARVASDDMLPEMVEELIRRAGAFPDRSIIDAYLIEPALQKLPDYIVACAIEELICHRRSPA